MVFFIFSIFNIGSVSFYLGNIHLKAMNVSPKTVMFWVYKEYLMAVMVQDKPVIVWHGLSTCSEMFVCSSPQDSLAFLLADRGYDVWLANARGISFG